MSRNSPAPRGFRGTPIVFRVGQNTSDGRHFTSFARSEQRTELRYPLEGIRSPCEVPLPPTALSPFGLMARWQVLRELRVTLCQSWWPSPRVERQITHFYPVSIHLSTVSLTLGGHFNYLVARFPQFSHRLFFRRRRFQSRVCQVVRFSSHRPWGWHQPQSVTASPGRATTTWDAARW